MGREQEHNPDQPLRNSSASRPAEGSRRLPTAPAANALGANFPRFFAKRWRQKTERAWRARPRPREDAEDIGVRGCGREPRGPVQAGGGSSRQERAV